MRRIWTLPYWGGLVALACALPVRADAPSEAEPEADSARAVRLAEVQNTFSGPTGGIRILDAGSGPKGSFRLALNTEFFITRDYFVSGDQAHAFAGNFSLTVTPTDFLEVFASAEVTSAWDDSNDPMLIQRVADLLLGLKGYGRIGSWVTAGGDLSLFFPGGVGSARSTFRATSVGLRGNVTLDLRDHARREAPVILRFNARYWFDNTANLTEDIEDRRYDALGGVIPRSFETRNLLTAFERFAYGVNRVDSVRLAAGFEAPLRVKKVGLHPLFEWQWDIPVNRQRYTCTLPTVPDGDSCLTEEGAKAWPMLLSLGLRILTPPNGLSFTVAADIGLTGTRAFVRELAPIAPYNIILGIGYAFDPGRPAAAPAPTTTESTGRVRGRVLEDGTGSPIAGARLQVAGADASAQVTDSEGGFVTYELPEGEALLELSHPDYSPASCSAQVPSEVDCLLQPVALEGRMRLFTIDRDGNPVPNVPVAVRGPEDRQLVTDQDGLGVLEDLEPGPYTVELTDPEYLLASRELDVAARQETSARLRAVRKPSRPRVVVKKSEIILRRQISFATGSDEILPNSEPLLLEVADAMLRNPDVELVEIQGHTDNVGDTKLNMELSQRRAESVERWLTQHGVDAERMEARGYGPTRPIAPNITAYNRARNRRVQFKIMRRSPATAAATR